MNLHDLYAAVRKALNGGTVTVSLIDPPTPGNPPLLQIVWRTNGPGGEPMRCQRAYNHAHYSSFKGGAADLAHLYASEAQTAYERFRATGEARGPG